MVREGVPPAKRILRLQALALCEAEGHNFRDGFSQQWVLAETPHADLPGFSHVPLGRWHLHHGPALPVARAALPEAGLHVALMGQAVDGAGRFVTDAVLADHLGRARDPSRLAEALSACGGRYAFVIVAPGLARLYLDPSGCLGAVYEPRARLVGATLYMALDRPVEPNTDYPALDIAGPGAGGRFAFGHTPDRHAKRLMCNHFLDLGPFVAHRHWPALDADFTCPLDRDAVEERIDRAVLRHRQVLGALTEAITPAMLPLTGGADARLLLAFCAPFLDRIDLAFVHRTNFNTMMDMRIAGELATRAGIALRRIDVVEETGLRKSKRFAARMNARQRIALGLLPGGPGEKKPEIEVRQALPPGGTVLRGNVTDLSKAVLWRRKGIAEFNRSRGRAHSTTIGVRMLMIGHDWAETDPWFKDAYAGWLGTLPEPARRRAIDFASLEHFRTHGQGAFFYATNRNFYGTPSADRAILEAFISLPPPIRDAFHVNDLMLERTMPELRDVPYTRRIDNEIRRTRPGLDDMLAAARADGERL